MALSGPTLSSQIQTALQGIGFTGTELTNLSNALGNGIVTSISGILTFTTSDVGTVPGTGAGIGTGILGMSNSNISTGTFNKGQFFWSSLQTAGPGIKWQDFCNTIASSVNSYLQTNATLTSVHTPVFAGTGTVTAYLGITIPAMKTNIVNAAPGSWASARFPELAEAVATGLVTEVLGHAPASTVIITGAPTGIPVPGTGTGTGIVT